MKSVAHVPLSYARRAVSSARWQGRLQGFLIALCAVSALVLVSLLGGCSLIENFDRFHVESAKLDGGTLDALDGATSSAGAGGHTGHVDGGTLDALDGATSSGNVDAGASEVLDAGAALDGGNVDAATALDAGAQLDASTPPPSCTYPKRWCAAGSFCGYCPTGKFCAAGSTEACADSHGCVYPITWCAKFARCSPAGGC